MNLNLCRLCYESEANIHIFRSTKVKDEKELYNKINHCCNSLHVNKNDGLPPLICEDCEIELDACYRFLLKCVATDEKLRCLLRSLSGYDENASEHHSLKKEVKSEPDCPVFNDDFFHADDRICHPPIDVKEELNLEVKHRQPFKSDRQIKKRYKKKTRLKKIDLICPVCDRQCLNCSALAVHMRSHTDERPFRCGACDKSYKDRGTLKRHEIRNHATHRDRNFICEHCGKGFYTKTDIQTHMRVHTKETPYACSECSARFTQLSAMLRHRRRHSGQKSHMCATCGKSFWTKTELKKHFAVHEEVKNFSCHICQLRFKHKGSVQKHMRVHMEPHRFICSHCGKGFNNKGNLKSHVERKHSDKSGQCEVCSKNVSDIEVHMWRHTGQRPLKCEFCSSSFYEMKALALHINFKHKKTDRFKCPTEGCQETFPSKPMMMFHVAKFHDQKTLFPCQRCSRGFYRKNDLARHMLGTHKERLP